MHLYLVCKKFTIFRLFFPGHEDPPMQFRRCFWIPPPQDLEHPWIFNQLDHPIHENISTSHKYYIFRSRVLYQIANQDMRWCYMVYFLPTFRCTFSRQMHWDKYEFSFLYHLRKTLSMWPTVSMKTIWGIEKCCMSELERYTWRNETLSMLCSRIYLRLSRLRCRALFDAKFTVYAVSYSSLTSNFTRLWTLRPTRPWAESYRPRGLEPFMLKQIWEHSLTWTRIFRTRHSVFSFSNAWIARLAFVEAKSCPLFDPSSPTGRLACGPITPRSIFFKQMSFLVISRDKSKTCPTQ